MGRKLFFIVAAFGFLALATAFTYDDFSDMKYADDIASGDGATENVYPVSDIPNNITERVEELALSADAIQIFMDEIEKVVMENEDIITIPADIDPQQHNISLEDAFTRLNEFLTEQMEESQNVFAEIENLIDSEKTPQSYPEAMEFFKKENASFEESELQSYKEKVLSIMEIITDATEDLNNYLRSKSINDYDYFDDEYGNSDQEDLAATTTEFSTETTTTAGPDGGVEGSSDSQSWKDIFGGGDDWKLPAWSNLVPTYPTFHYDHLDKNIFDGYKFDTGANDETGGLNGYDFDSDGFGTNDDTFDLHSSFVDDGNFDHSNYDITYDNYDDGGSSTIAVAASVPFGIIFFVLITWLRLRRCNRVVRSTVIRRRTVQIPINRPAPRVAVIGICETTTRPRPPTNGGLPSYLEVISKNVESPPPCYESCTGKDQERTPEESPPNYSEEVENVTSDVARLIPNEEV